MKSYSEPDSLNKSVEIRSHPRPIKIAYIVPFEEKEENHWILDAIFHEAYSRWGGARTLVIPSTQGKFLDEQYENWIHFFDPDFIYTYVDITESFIQDIEKICLPITLKKRKSFERAERWRDYLPEWDFCPVSSLSTLTTIKASLNKYDARNFHTKRILLTQYNSPSEERFVPDNFGTSWSVNTITNPIPDFFETFCFVEKNITKHMNVGTESTSNLGDILTRIVSGKVTTFSHLSKINSESILDEPISVEDSSLRQYFTVFLGESCLDRINFWNYRSLTREWKSPFNSIILRKDLLKNTDFLSNFGKFLDTYAQTEKQYYPIYIKSYSIDYRSLLTTKEILSKVTQKNILVEEKSFNRQTTLTFHNKSSIFKTQNEQWNSFQVFEKKNNITSEEPKHFQSTPPKDVFANNGQWIVEVDIERHNTHEFYINTINGWMLPKRITISNAFTKNRSRVTRGNLLALMPLKKETNRKARYELYLPSDDIFFRHAISPTFSYVLNLPSDDLRESIKRDWYKKIKLSDKGENLRGIISMFENFKSCCSIMTSPVWRSVLNKFGAKKYISYNEIRACIPNDKQFKKKLSEQLNFSNKKINNYIEAALKDTLEYLVQKKIFFQVHNWRCSYCGHGNILSLDELKQTNKCNICSHNYLAPIDFKWNYQINPFVTETLHDRSGISVLRALYWLFENCINTSSFCFLPEVNLYKNHAKSSKKNEIDIMCVKDGIFSIAEVKKTAAGFVDKSEEIDKFIEKTNLLRPDVAFLIFENYSENTKEHELYKNKLESIVKNIGKKIQSQNIEVSHVILDNCRHSIDALFKFQGSRILKLDEKNEKF